MRLSRSGPPMNEYACVNVISGFAAVMDVNVRGTSSAQSVPRACRQLNRSRVLACLFNNAFVLVGARVPVGWVQPGGMEESGGGFMDERGSLLLVCAALPLFTQFSAI